MISWKAMIVFWCGIALLIGIYVSIKPRVDLENGTSHQFISDVSLDNRSVWFCPVTDHGDWLCGNYTLADNVIMLPSVHWYNRTNVLVDAYWDGTWYTGDDGGTYKHLVGIYGNTSRWVLDSWVWATLSHGVVINLTEGWNESRV